MLNCPKVTDLFPVDLGIDLRALQPEITKCKKRFQQDLWNTICSRVLEGQSGWKKDSKSKSKSKSKSEEGETKEEEDAAKDTEENKPEESGENENNELVDRPGNWNSAWSQGRLSRQRIPARPRLQLLQQQQQQQQPQQPGILYPAMRRGTSIQGYPRVAIQRQPQPQWLPQPQPQWLPQPQPQPQWLPQPQPQPQWSGGGANHNDGGELTNFLTRIRPQEGVLDWRHHQLAAVDRYSRASAANHARSFSATSRREILGAAATLEDDEGVEVSEALERAQVFYGAAPQSDGESTAQYYMNNAANCHDGATNASVLSREFVPLVVGSWAGQGYSSRQN